VIESVFLSSLQSSFLLLAPASVILQVVIVWFRSALPLKIFNFILVLSPMTCVIDFSYRGPPGRGSARSMGNSCASGGSKDLILSFVLLLTTVVQIFHSMSKIQNIPLYSVK
jgi:hypothetical protein